MDNEEILLILREIRDLQKLHVENYKEAMASQRAFIADQKKARSVAIMVLVALMFFLGFFVTR